MGVNGRSRAYKTYRDRVLQLYYFKKLESKSSNIWAMEETIYE
jgi:hypothetical protein